MVFSSVFSHYFYVAQPYRWQRPVPLRGVGNPALMERMPSHPTEMAWMGSGQYPTKVVDGGGLIDLAHNLKPMALHFSVADCPTPSRTPGKVSRKPGWKDAI
ncbi:hypothetical protein [Microbulbifer guangxiensis]|uniref:hypothetical protein n=1 Tax=Microbulbifer guangxiensis TaxID=2904249 RepID=UPI001F44817A|nr:hypothetical protein [Microbulbifer guangxiensis]